MQVIATQITTLDEARYFAAMGADWIGFDGEKLNADEIKTICDWVVGPEVFVEYRSLHEEQIFELTHKISLAGVCVPASVDLPEWFQGQIIFRADAENLSTDIPAEAIVLSRSHPGIEQMTTQGQCWVEIDPGDDLDHLKALSAYAGIAIRCHRPASEEMEFEQYDAIFEKIEGM